jgi:hypothetical protein
VLGLVFACDVTTCSRAIDLAVKPFRICARRHAAFASRHRSTSARKIAHCFGDASPM